VLAAAWALRRVLASVDKTFDDLADVFLAYAAWGRELDEAARVASNEIFNEAIEEDDDAAAAERAAALDATLKARNALDAELDAALAEKPVPNRDR
jgi:hypothetical protein